VYSPLIGKSILRRIHPMKELTEITLTDLWKEFNQSFRDLKIDIEYRKRVKPLLV
jgi:hypothetical protein